MDISKITEHLYVGAQPLSPGDYGILHDLGIVLIINMRAKRGPVPDPIRPAIRTVWIETRDNPLRPIPIESLVRGVVESKLTIEENGKVFVHCAAGKHRSVAMAACILIAGGHSAEQAMQTVKHQRPKADPDAGHIKERILAFEEHWEQE